MALSPKQMQPSSFEQAVSQPDNESEGKGQLPEEIIVDLPGQDRQGSKSGANQHDSQPFSSRKLSAPAQRHRRLRSPGLKWYKNYDGENCFPNGRVLVIDYIKQGTTLAEGKINAGQSKQGTRKVAAQEFDSIHGLKHLYSSPDHIGEPSLRVIHAQNADWATRFLLHKFNIHPRDEIVGTDFGRWVKWKRPESRGGKPFMNGKTWATTHDPWRGISRTSFGLDYLKQYKCKDYRERSQEDSRDKVFELNHYNEQDEARYGFDVFTQRISCYIQHKDDVSDAAQYPGIPSPYDETRKPSRPDQYVPQLDTLDNGNVIIIFENSKNGTPWDTLISARARLESRWRRLPFHLSLESHDLSDDDKLADECMKVILSDIWKAAAENWEFFLDCCNTHMSILEDKIYEGPADESRAPELWTNSAMWLKVERLVAIHQALVKEMQANLQELTGDPEDIWLSGTTDDLKKLAELVQEDLAKPTTNLADLMYRSVEIRDSRHSLQLNTSMWRLSWITFIFLPLTFLSTFFGMNVTTFESNPSIRWYFAAAAPMMLIVLLGWYSFKHSLASQRQSPFMRGVYEEMFYKMALSYPQLWARSGPRSSIQPKTRLDKLRWRLILMWNDPDKTTRKSPGDEASFEDLSVGARVKRYFTSRWTKQLRRFDDKGDSDAGAALENGNLEDDVFSLSGEKLNKLEGKSTQSAPVSVVMPTTKFANAQEIEHRLEVPATTFGSPLEPVQIRSRIVSDGSGGSRPGSAPDQSVGGSRRSRSSGRTSAIMVEEEPTSWLKDYGTPDRFGRSYFRG